MLVFIYIYITLCAFVVCKYKNQNQYLFPFSDSGSFDSTFVKQKVDNDSVMTSIMAHSMKDNYIIEQDPDSGFESIELNNNEIQRALSPIHENEFEVQHESLNIKVARDSKVQNISVHKKCVRQPVLEPRPDSPVGHEEYLTIDDSKYD